jgi:hypothetical protein
MRWMWPPSEHRPPGSKLMIAELQGDERQERQERPRSPAPLIARQRAAISIGHRKRPQRDLRRAVTLPSRLEDAPRGFEKIRPRQFTLDLMRRAGRPGAGSTSRCNGRAPSAS